MSSLEFIGVCGLVAAVCILFVWYVDRRKSFLRMQTECYLRTLKDFTETETIYGGNRVALSLDVDRVKICIINQETTPPTFEVLSCAELLACEVVEDGGCIALTDQSCLLDSALAGTRFAKKKSRRSESNLELRLTISGRRRLPIVVQLWKGPMVPNDLEYIKLRKRVLDCADTISNMMRLARPSSDAQPQISVTPLISAVVNT